MLGLFILNLALLMRKKFFEQGLSRFCEKTVLECTKWVSPNSEIPLSFSFTALSVTTFVSIMADNKEKVENQVDKSDGDEMEDEEVEGGNLAQEVLKRPDILAYLQDQLMARDYVRVGGCLSPD